MYCFHSKIEYLRLMHCTNVHRTDMWVLSSKDSKSVKMDALCSFKMFRTNYPAAQCHIPEEQNPHTDIWLRQNSAYMKETKVLGSLPSQCPQFLLTNILTK
jgi:hypothetical protein